MTAPHAARERCELRRDDIIVVEAWNGKGITGDQFLKRVAQCRGMLIEAGVREADTVGIFLERTIDTVAMIFSIWELGAIYVPLDTTLPDQRLLAIASNAELRVVVALPANPFPGTTPSVAPPATDLAEPNRTNQQIVATKSSIAYVMYTSGSTGVPKGVVVTHANLAAFLQSWDSLVDLAQPGTWLGATPLAFDPSIVELIWTITRGATVVLSPSGRDASNSAISQAIVEYGVTHVQCTPTRARMLLDDQTDAASLGEIQELFIGGEALTASLAQRLFATGIARLTNIYGPTETTVWAFAHPVAPTDSDPMPIGTPLPGIEIKLGPPRDDHEQGATDHCAPRELWIGGASVTSGYRLMPDQTEAAFVVEERADAAIAPDIWYHTGDLVTQRSDGAYLFRGRNDYQVKVSGLRIELGEIEAVLEADPNIAQAIVGVSNTGPGEPTLVSWVRSSARQTLDQAQIRAGLARVLPIAMVPRQIIQVDEFPLTTTGKVNRKELAARTEARSNVGDRNVSTLSIVERGFCEVLHRSTVSSTDDFFALGGHSLAAVWLTNFLEEHRGVVLPLRALIDAPTPAGLAALIDRDHTKTSTDPGSARVLVRFSPRRAVPQLYIVHGAGGNVVGLRDLAVALADHADVVGIQAIGVEPGAQPDTTMQAMAHRYATAILADQRSAPATAPTLLGGYSEGGRIALEIAATFPAITTSPIALFDTPVRDELPRSRIQRIKTAVGNHRDRGPQTSTRWARESFSLWRTRHDRDPLNQRVRRPLDVIIESATSATPIARNVNVGALLVRATDRNPFYQTDYDWEAALGVPVRTYWVEGQHLTMFRPPQVTSVADALRVGYQL